MKRFLLVCLMMTCSVSWADWEMTGTVVNKERILYHDKSTIRRNGVIAKMWGMDDYSLPQENSGGQKYQSVKILYAFNCIREELAIISINQYSDSMGKGEGIFSITTPESELKWEVIVPGSVREERWKIACGKK